MTPRNRASSPGNYVVLDESLAELKRDFNALNDRVRLLFIVGPTCGICLRGMADLNDEFIADLQADARLQTFVVHVPTLGAREEHVAQTIPLLDGPHVTHYWDSTGIIGSHYHDLLNIGLYVWDFWAIYRAGVTWDDVLPTIPDHWEHQLQSLPRDLRLDPPRFAATVRSLLENAPRAPSSEQRVASDSGLVTDVTVIPVVTQPRGVAIQQHIIGRGGYRNLKRIDAIERRGSITFDGRSLPLRVSARRPNRMERVVTASDGESVASFDGEEVSLTGPETPRGLDAELERKILGAFEFDGVLVEWKDKGHQAEMLGMRKLGKTLTWELAVQQEAGPHWTLLVDSHSGHIVRATMFDSSTGEPWLSIHQDDFREVSGFSFPYHVEYRDQDGILLAMEQFTEISVIVSPFRLSEDEVTH